MLVWLIRGYNGLFSDNFPWVCSSSSDKIPLMQCLLTKCDKACPLDETLLYFIQFQYLSERFNYLNTSLLQLPQIAIELLRSSIGLESIWVINQKSLVVMNLIVRRPAYQSAFMVYIGAPTYFPPFWNGGKFFCLPVCLAWGRNPYRKYLLLKERNYSKI